MSIKTKQRFPKLSNHVSLWTVTRVIPRRMTMMACPTRIHLQRCPRRYGYQKACCNRLLFTTKGVENCAVTLLQPASSQPSRVILCGAFQSFGFGSSVSQSLRTKPCTGGKKQTKKTARENNSLYDGAKGKSPWHKTTRVLA